MHIVLTDILTCPRCGPEFGLVVLADELEGRHVVAGRLGCANCREEFPVRGGVADLRFPAGSAPAPPAEPREEGWTYRLAALLGLSEAGGPVLVAGADPQALDALAELVPHVLVVGATRGGPAGAGSAANRVLYGASLPFRSGSLRGVALVDGAPEELLDEAVRVLARGGRLVVDPAPPNTADRLRLRGLEPLLEEDGVTVASATGPG